MSTAGLVASLERRGLRLRVDGADLAIRPPSAVTQEDIEVLRRVKPEVLTFLRERQAKELLATVVKVQLRNLIHTLEVAVPWCDVPLLIAPGCRVARELRQADPKPGRVWCVCEVLDLLLTAVPPEDAQRIGQARVTFDAQAVVIRKQETREARS